MEDYEVKVSGFKCLRCGNIWVKNKKTEGNPRVCPKCKTPYWDRPRKNEVD